MELLVLLAIPFLTLAFLRWLSHRWMPWAMQPLERLLFSVSRLVWRLVWTLPARTWGAINVLWVWLLIITVVGTMDAVYSRSIDEPLIVAIWIVVGLAYWGLRALAQWRLRPRRLPARRRRED